jgi:SNF2 family DNA or RNA helicase
LAVILARPCPNADDIPDPMPPNLMQMKYKIKTTLIVCPVSLIDQWRREIEGKTDPQLNVLAFHGKRTDSIKEIAEYDGMLYI